VRVALCGLLALQAPLEAMAQCICGFDDGILTTHTPMLMDGAMADWGPILADPDQNTCDGPAGGLADRDAPVQSTGRDLVHFSLTWDDANLYLFTERVGSSNNIQRFLYYGDADNDGLLETGEPVIGVNWQGNTRLIEVYLFQYVAAAAGGDPMTDGLGFSDGYTLPGSFQNVPNQNSPTRAGNWGSASGLQMEFNVTWAELGVAPGAAFTFHVASANSYFGASNYPSKIDDNLGGCGGGPGTTQSVNLAFVPDVNLSGAHAELVVAAHTVTNTGNGDDTFDLASVISGDHAPTTSYYEDVDVSGTLSAGDTPVADSDGDGTPDTGLLAPGAIFDLLIAYLIGDVTPSDPNGVARSVTSATSSVKLAVSASVTDTVTVVLAPLLEVAKVLVTLSDPVNGTTEPKGIPGATIAYSVSVTNRGGEVVDPNTVVITDPIPTEAALWVGDVGLPGSGPIDFADGSPSSGLSYTFVSLGSATDAVDFSSDGGSSWSYAPSPGGSDPNVTHVRVRPRGSFAAATAAGDPSFRVTFWITVR
jgi:uncharacterized repeat protein (TIGR01451 family)